MPYPINTPSTDLEITDEYGVHLNHLGKLCYGLAANAGWWTNIETGEPLDRNKGEMIALMHSELSEALEGVRKNSMDDKLPHRIQEAVELADTIIRIMDYAEAYNLDVGGAVVEKLRFNCNRPDHKIENRLKDDGKKC